MPPLYTIGHGARKWEDFVFLLEKYGIQYLVDVRSVPYSRFHPQFNQATMKVELEKRGISYVFLGDQLGGRPQDPACFNGEGKIDYRKIREQEFFKQGLERIKTGYQKELMLALMCSERNPCHCHRSKLIGEALWDEGIMCRHIDESGRLKDQSQVRRNMEIRKAGGNLFKED